VGEVASALFVSESYLSRLFRRELHQSPGRYIRDKRLLVARDRIAQGEHPSAVAAACGFSDYTTFWRGYKALFGTPPSVKKDP
jgi:AraC-like DNA-binding protein